MGPSRDRFSRSRSVWPIFPRHRRRILSLPDRRNSIIYVCSINHPRARAGLFDIWHTLDSKVRNGPPFQSAEFADFAKRLGFRHHRVTPHWPEANGTAERFMRNLNKILYAQRNQKAKHGLPSSMSS